MMRVLAWPRSPRKSDVVAGEQRVGELREDRVVVADDALDERLARRRARARRWRGALP